jgi:hypothetical protein
MMIAMVVTTATDKRKRSKQASRVGCTLDDLFLPCYETGGGVRGGEASLDCLECTKHRRRTKRGALLAEVCTCARRRYWLLIVAVCTETSCCTHCYEAVQEDDSRAGQLDCKRQGRPTATAGQNTQHLHRRRRLLRRTCAQQNTSGKKHCHEKTTT